MRYFRIGEFAKYCGTSVPFLKYYDKEGLISPIYKDDRGYRYYGDYQMVHFSELYKLTRMGFPVKEAKTLHRFASCAQLKESLSRRRVLLAQEVREQQFALAYLDKLNTAVGYTEQADSWFIEPMAEAWFCIPHAVSAAGNSGAWWKIAQVIPEIWHRTEWTFPDEPDWSDLSSHQIWGTLIWDREQAHSDRFEVLAEVPPSRCFVHYHSVAARYEESAPQFSDHVWNCKDSLDILKAHSLTPRGDLYQQRLFVTHEDGGPLVHIETRIPLK